MTGVSDSSLATLDELTRIVMSMRGETRQVFTLRKVYQMKIHDIAIQMGIAEKRVVDCLEEAILHLDRQLRVPDLKESQHA